MKFVKKIYQNGQEVKLLNELEFVDGSILANVYLSREIVQIDLKSDKILRTFDFSFLLQSANDMALQMTNKSIRYDECLNGIAFNRETKKLFITGKNWPVMYDIEFDDKMFKKEEK